MTLTQRGAGFCNRARLLGKKRMTEGWMSLDINIKNYKDQLVLYSLDNKYHIKYKKRERKNGN